MHPQVKRKMQNKLKSLILRLKALNASGNASPDKIDEVWQYIVYYRTALYFDLKNRNTRFKLIKGGLNG